MKLQYIMTKRNFYNYISLSHRIIWSSINLLLKLLILLAVLKNTWKQFVAVIDNESVCGEIGVGMSLQLIHVTDIGKFTHLYRFCRISTNTPPTSIPTEIKGQKSNCLLSFFFLLFIPSRSVFNTTPIFWAKKILLLLTGTLYFFILFWSIFWSIFWFIFDDLFD